MKAILLALPLALSACATAYQPTGFTGGFSEIRLADNIFRITFEGNGYTNASQAGEMALLRSAELVLKNGFHYFAIRRSTSNVSTSAYTTPMTASTTFSANRFGNQANGTATTRIYGGDTIISNRPTTVVEVEASVFPDQSMGTAYRASYICESLGPKYKVTCNAPAK